MYEYRISFLVEIEQEEGESITETDAFVKRIAGEDWIPEGFVFDVERRVGETWVSTHEG